MLKLINKILFTSLTSVEIAVKRLSFRNVSREISLDSISSPLGLTDSIHSRVKPEMTRMQKENGNGEFSQFCSFPYFMLTIHY